MSNTKYTTEQVAGIVDCEGLGYAVTDYLGADSIEDPELARLWRQAKEALDEINEILEEAYPDGGEGPEDGI